MACGPGLAGAWQSGDDAPLSQGYAKDGSPLPLPKVAGSSFARRATCQNRQVPHLIRSVEFGANFVERVATNDAAEVMRHLEGVLDAKEVTVQA